MGMDPARHESGTGIRKPSSRRNSLPDGSTRRAARRQLERNHGFTRRTGPFECMASKMVIDRKKKARALEAAAREHARSVGEAFQSLLPESVREGVGGQNLSALVETLGDRFAELSDGLVEVDESGVVRLDDDRMARRERTLAVVASAAIRSSSCAERAG